MGLRAYFWSAERGKKKDVRCCRLVRMLSIIKSEALSGCMVQRTKLHISMVCI